MRPSLTPPFDLNAWIEANRNLLQPPVGNKCLWPGGEFIVMAVGGPNQRSDFHINPTPEFFHQLQGDMVLRVRADGAVHDIAIRQGEVFLLPAGVPHSPQRPANTVGLVLEQQRPEGQKDGLVWYCENCSNVLYEEYFILKNVETDFPPVFRHYRAGGYSTCGRCGHANA